CSLGGGDDSTPMAGGRHMLVGCAHGAVAAAPPVWARFDRAIRRRCCRRSSDVRARVARTRWPRRARLSARPVCRARAGPMTLTSRGAVVSAPLLHALTAQFHTDRVVPLTGFIDHSLLSRIHRLEAGGRHFDSWHTDLDESRTLGMSVNLSAEPYEG